MGEEFPVEGDQVTNQIDVKPHALAYSTTLDRASVTEDRGKRRKPRHTGGCTLEQRR